MEIYMGMTNTISFNKLGIFDLEINRVAIDNIFGTGIDIYWYAVIITFGMILAISFCMWQSKKFGFTSDELLDVCLWGVPCALIGARLYFVIFMLDHFDSLWDMINFRNGGLAIYGGIIAAFIVGLVYCKIKKKNALALFDLASFGFFIGQSIGRWGNFVNAEAYGSVTDLPWGMSINGAEAVHPTFIYESLWNLIGFLIAFIVIKRVKKEHGEIFCFYMGWYGLGRAFIEGLRQDSLKVLGVFRISQILGLVFFVGAIVLFILIRKGVIRKITEKIVQKQVDKQNSYTNVFEGSEDEASVITVNESDLFMASLESHRGRNREDEENVDENNEENK
ncbi:MAG: prolipoprotein diacylglyceryl transferase [Clostridia bacterium]|nr:prolipoprotein diacylglyceryl transferase [Clostridia bacterium]